MFERVLNEEETKKLVSTYEFEVFNPQNKRRVIALQKYRTQLCEKGLSVAEVEEKVVKFLSALRKVAWEKFYYYLLTNAPVKRIVKPAESARVFLYSFVLTNEINTRSPVLAQYKSHLEAKNPGKDMLPVYLECVRTVRDASTQYEYSQQAQELVALCYDLRIDELEALSEKYELLSKQSRETNASQIISSEDEVYLREGYSLNNEININKYELAIRKDSFQQFLT